MATVAFVKVKEVSKRGISDAVKKAMELANWKKYVKGKKIFVKINGISDQVVPGQCTSPYVIEPVLEELKKLDAEISMGDADLAAAKQLNRAAKYWGFIKLAKKHKVKFVNLSEDKLIKTKVNGKIFKELEIPKTLLDADCIVNIPVAKTHCLTSLTCCLKNHWGMVPRGVRHNYHLVADQCIADINHFFKKTTFNVVDATICMEDNAPRTGIPIVTNAIFASNDRVATDTAVAKFMGYENYKEIPHIVKSEEMGVGERKFRIVGDKLEIHNFKKPRPNIQPIFFWEMSLRKVPLINWIIFRTKIFSIFAWIATKYNTFYWYNVYGKKYIRKIINETEYGKLYKPIVRRAGVRI